MLKQVEISESDGKEKLVVAVTMATGRQGIGVVKELSQTDKYQIRAITRNTKSTKALEIGSLNNVELVKGDLICTLAWNNDGERLSPENGTCLYHTFAVHKELFQGLD